MAMVSAKAAFRGGKQPWNSRSARSTDGAVLREFLKSWVRSALLIGVVLPALAQRAPLFKSEILPVLEKNCVKCHSPSQKMAGLDLSTFTGMMTGGSSGVVISPGKPQRSMLWKMIETDKMPMGGK